jgi:UDP-2,3-diacylglucosamine pyrophosphatase LpxH
MKTNNNTSIVISDVHLPFSQPVATQMVVDFIRELKPDRIHLLGDVLDAQSVSRFDKDPVRKENLQDELDSVRDWLTELRDAAPRAKIIYSEGNHEFRIRKYLMSEAKALAGLRALSLEKLVSVHSILSFCSQIGLLSRGEKE